MKKDVNCKKITQFVLFKTKVASKVKFYMMIHGIFQKPSLYTPTLFLSVGFEQYLGFQTPKCVKKGSKGAKKEQKTHFLTKKCVFFVKKEI